MAAATRGGQFDEYNYRCACIAQLVEQLTLKQSHVAASSGLWRTPADTRRTTSQLTHIESPGQAVNETVNRSRESGRAELFKSALASALTATIAC